MRLARYFIFLFIATFMGLLYVHQQFLIVKANYDIRKCEIQLSQLLDHNKKLEYNVNQLESPATLEKKLSLNGIALDMPKRWAVAAVKTEKSVQGYNVALVADRRNVFVERILNFITRKADAQALGN